MTTVDIIGNEVFKKDLGSEFGDRLEEVLQVLLLATQLKNVTFLYLYLKYHCIMYTEVERQNCAKLFNRKPQALSMIL